MPEFDFDDVIATAHCIVEPEKTVADMKQLREQVRILREVLEQSIQFVAKWSNDHDSTIGHRYVARMESALEQTK